MSQISRIETPPGAPGAASGGHLSDAARAALEAGIPDSTRRAYTGDVRRFARWCAEHGYGGLPAAGTVLTEYAAWAAGQGWAPATIERARWAILKWHSLAGVPAPATAGLVGVLKGYRAQLAKSHSPKAVPRKAAPAGKDSIRAMLATLDRSTLAGKRDAAIILVGFAIAGRRSEIAGLDIGSLTFEARGMQIEVYRQKTRTMDDPVVHYRPDRSVCPVRAAGELIAALAACGRASGPLFVRISRHGHPGRPMTRNGVPIGDPSGRLSGQAVAQVIRRCAVTAGLPGRWSGHSLRRGLATSMHRAGADREKIERQGGWTAGSRAVSGYIEESDRWLNDVLDGVL